MNTLALLAALTVFRVDPWYHEPILPDADPKCGVVTDDFPFAAAKGEFEAVSFVVRPDRDLLKVDVVPSDLTEPGGGRIPADAADVTLVKVWFRPGGRWVTSYAGNRGKPEPINNLLLHDDAVVKVDFENKVNYVRGRYSDGYAYLNMSRTDIDTAFNDSLEPVSDAPKFVPFDLRKGFRQQYLVTWRVPKEAKPGDYVGTVRLVSAGADLATLKLRLHVHPFSLPLPRTHYDTTQFYTSYWMGTPSLERLIAKGHRLDRAERKLRAVLRNMVDHNAINLSGVGTLAVDSTDDYALRTLLIARQEGMCAYGLINGKAFDGTGGFVWNPGGRCAVPEENPELYRQSLDLHRKAVKAQMAIMDKYLGHHHSYYSSVDECGVGTNRRSYGHWNVIHELGGRVWTDSAHAKDSGVFIDMNDIAAHVDHLDNWGWRQSGAKAVSYAAPFTGPECPDIWRRVKGIRFWYADFDGPHEYALIDAVNRWNEFVKRSRYCQFGMGFLTYDGMISTLSWDAVRESLDDVRYFTLLRLRAEAAMRSDDPRTRQLGRDAIVWQDGVDPEYVVDLNAFRLDVARWIERLIAKVGPQPEERPVELPPPATLPPDSRWQGVPKASAGATAVFKYADSCGPRYDLALEALYNLFRDAKSAPSDRATAAVRIAGLHAEMRERSQAVKVLEDALAVRGVTSEDRGKLCLKRVNVMMTDEKFEEKYTAAHLEKAAQCLEMALKFPGMDETERYDVIRKLADGYLAANQFETCVSFATARLADTKLNSAHQADVLITVARAWMGLKAWDKAMKAFKDAHLAFNNDKDKAFRRKILLFEADAAEKAKDYNRAVWCWMELIPTYSEEEKDWAKRARGHVKRLQPLARKNSKVDVGTLNDDDSSDAISLDE